MGQPIVKFVFSGVLLLALLLVFQETSAQCPMCKAAAESSIREGETDALGLNTGILYLFFAPYLVIGVIGFIWYRNQMKKREEFREEEIGKLLR